MEKDWLTSAVLDDAARKFSGSVLRSTNPKHTPSPIRGRGVVRWCRCVVSAGFRLYASHYEEFLRTTGSDVRFVKMTRGAGT